MRTRTRALVAGSGLAVALAVGVPVALADTGGSAPSTPATASSTTTASCSVPHPVADYLKAHPDVVQEEKTIRALPKDQRAAARKAYLSQHADVASALKQAAQQARADWPQRIAPAGQYLAAHPDLAGLLDQLKAAPQAQQAGIAQKYLADHPHAPREVQGLIRALRGHAGTCATTGG